MSPIGSVGLRVNGTITTLICFVVTCGLSSVSALRLEGAEAEEILARVRRELPEAHRRLRERYTNVKVTGVYKKKAYTADFTYYVSGNSFQYELRYDKKHRIPSYPDGHVYSVKDGSAFRLEYVSAGDQYLIATYGTEKKLVVQQSYNADARIKRFLFAPFQAEMLAPAEAVTKSSFVLKSAKTVMENGRETVEIVATWKIDPDYWKGARLESARMTFVPSLDWAMIKWHLIMQISADGKDQGTEERTATIQYTSAETNGSFYPREIQFRVKSQTPGKPDFVAQESVKIESFEVGVVSEDQFSPAAYGLPDYLKSQLAWYQKMWFWIVMLNVLALIAVVWYLLRRRAQT